MNVFFYLLLGLVAGIFSGLIGIGGAIIIIPSLVLLFGMSQHTAQGTTLALMVPPIGLLAAKFATRIPEDVLRKIFGVILLAASLRMIFYK